MDFEVVRAPRGATVSATSLELPASLAFDEWLAVGARLRLLENAILWWIGDWLAFGERTYGKTYAAAAEATGLASETVRGAAYVASRIESVRRRTGLPFSHHREVAALSPADQESLLSAAEEGGWTRNQLRREIKVHKRRAEAALSFTGPACAVDDLFVLSERGVRFRTIYADPPWKYDNQDTRASTDNHYSTMGLDEMSSLPVDRLADDHAHLHLWATSSFVFEARQLMEDWGFQYRSTFIWVKPGLGLGNYWRVGHEVCLLGTRGSLEFADRSQRSWQEWERTGHSQKPAEMYRIIEQVSPGPYLELFARSTRDGWTSWGNEIPRNALFQGA